MVLAEQPESKTICLDLGVVTAPRKSSSMNEGKAKTASLLHGNAGSAPRKGAGERTKAKRPNLNRKEKLDYRHQRAEGAQQAGRHEHKQAN